MPSCPMMETSANVHTEPEAPRRQGRTCRDRQRTPPKKRHDPKRATPECPASHERASGLYAQCARPRASHELNNGRAEPALRLNALDPRIPRISHKRGLECTGGSSSQIWMCARHGQGALVCDGFSWAYIRFRNTLRRHERRPKSSRLSTTHRGNKHEGSPAL